MAAQHVSSTQPSTSRNIFPFIPPTMNGQPISYKMSKEPVASHLRVPALPAAALSTLSLQDDSQATPVTKERKALSESSLSTMTPPDSNGIPVITGSRKQPAEVLDKIFVKAQDEDDVFGRNSAATSNQAVKPRSSNSVAIAKVQANLATPVSFKQNPRPDRMNSPITPANAQGVLPPEACVFVANLATNRSDDQLELACHEQFDVFGECHVKRVEDANNAIRSSQDIVIDGRSIRTEHAQARRSLVLTKLDGGAVTPEEASEALSGYGPIAKMHPTTHGDAREFGLPPGMWVEFAYYLDYKDALKTFNNANAHYRIHVPPEVEPRTQIGASGSPVVRGFRTPRSSTDQKSIFVGNLPSQTTEQNLRDMFSHCGLIKAINIIHKPIQGGNGYNIFGFVEFSTISEAEHAATMEIELNGSKIRVEPKEYSARRHTRLRPFSQARSPYNSHYPSMHHLYGHPLPFGYGGYLPMHGLGHYANNYAQNANDMTPFHQQGGFNNLYATPPPSSRMMRRNDMAYNGSPLNVAQWSPFIGSHGYNTPAMMQIPEELNGQRF